MCIFFNGQHRRKCYNLNKPKRGILKRIAWTILPLATVATFIFFLEVAKPTHQYACSSVAGPFFDRTRDSSWCPSHRIDTRAFLLSLISQNVRKICMPVVASRQIEKICQRQEFSQHMEKFKKGRKSLNVASWLPKIYLTKESSHLSDGDSEQPDYCLPCTTQSRPANRLVSVPEKGTFHVSVGNISR